MKKIIGLICTGIALTTVSFAQRPAPTPEQLAAQKAQAEATAADRQNMMDQLHITKLRPGKNGMDTSAPDFTNYDESKANPYPVWPDPLTFKNGKKVTSAAEWPKRRAEIVEDFDREIYGRMPANVPPVKWTVVKEFDETMDSIPVTTKWLNGHVDNSAYPDINVDIHLIVSVPKTAKSPVPVIMNFGRASFDPAPESGTPRLGPPATTNTKPASRQVLERGWAWAVLDPSTIQADNGAGLTKGIIGLVNKGQYRKPDDWGALRAWAWGADRAIDYFETDKTIDAKRVAIQGHSRYGKAALVSLAYDPRMATAFVSSSGEAGAKPLRRNIGEIVENITAASEYHWMAGNFLKYGGPLQWDALPVDAHELIALCAPRPVFISGGKSGNGGVDAWVDSRGMFMAADAAGPVYTLLGKDAMKVHEFPPIETLIDGDVAFRQHAEGHTPTPNWPYFLAFAAKYF